MSDGILESELAQKLDAAYADYQRRVGRPRAMERLRHMLARAEAAQRVLDASTENIGSALPRAAE